MESVNKRSATILNALTKNLVEPSEKGESYQRFEGAIPIDVERISTFVYTVTRYMRVEGEIVNDPQMFFFAVRSPVSEFDQGDWIPLSLEKSGEVTHGVIADDELKMVNMNFHEKHVSFANRWLNEISQQVSL